MIARYPCTRVFARWVRFLMSVVPLYLKCMFGGRGLRRETSILAPRLKTTRKSLQTTRKSGALSIGPPLCPYGDVYCSSYNLFTSGSFKMRCKSGHVTGGSSTCSACLAAAASADSASALRCDSSPSFATLLADCGFGAGLALAGLMPNQRLGRIAETSLATLESTQMRSTRPRLTSQVSLGFKGVGCRV